MDTCGLNKVRTAEEGRIGLRNRNSGTPVLMMLIYPVIGVLILTGGPGRTWAGSISESFTITARVLPFVKATILMQQEHLIVSESDARRGLVEITNGSLIEIKNNVASGCLLTVETNGFPIEWASVNIQGREIILRENGGFIHWPFRGSITVPVGYVIALKPGTRPGIYPWPFRLTVSF